MNASSDTKTEATANFESITQLDLAQALSEALGQRVDENSIRALQDGAQAIFVADATAKFYVSLPDSTKAFLIVSSAINPDLIGRASRNIAQARACLSTSVAAPVLPTIASGHVKGLSFALWPCRAALQSGGKLGRYVQRFRFAPHICNWHINLVSETLSPAAPETYLENLAIIANDQNFSKPVRQAAERGQDRLGAGEGSLQHCLQHGDFWLGNLLLPNAKDDAPFFVIDWAGMNSNGYPFIDLCSMLMSLRCSKHFATRQIKTLQARVGGDQTDVVTSVLSGLGHLGQNLEHFPPERYRQMAEDVFHFADQTSR